MEIIGGRGYEFFDTERIKPVSFTLFEDFPRNVEIRYGRSRQLIVANFDGYHVSLGLEDEAKVIPPLNGVVQEIGDGQGLKNVEVVIYWEDDGRGGVRYYKEKTPTSKSVEQSDSWGENLKRQRLGSPKKKGPVSPTKEKK